MRNLLKSDLKRIIKDKLFLIVCIIGAAFAVFTPLLYKLIVLGIDEEMAASFLFGSFRGMLFQSFNLSSNFGLIVPIFIIIILCKDFSYGTVRNKIICGHSRTKIFLSTLISSIIIVTGLIFTYFLISWLLYLLLFSKSVDKITGASVAYFIGSLGLEALVCIFVAALISFLSVFMKNSGLSVVVYAAITIGASMLYGIVLIAILSMSTDPEKVQVVKTLNIFQYFNIYYNNAVVIGLTETYKIEEIIYMVLASMIGIATFVGLGIFVFNKKDIK